MDEFGGKKMEKTEFLKEVSMMSRQDIEKLLNRNSKKKKICPVFFIRRESDEDKDKGLHK